MDQCRRAEIRKRLILVSAGLSLFGVILLFQLARWQLIQGTNLAEVASGDINRYEIIEPRRGTIYSRDGRILATDIYSCELAVAPRELEDPYVLADRLFPLIHVSRRVLLEKMISGSAWQILARNVPLHLAEEIESWGEAGVYLQPQLSRAYTDSFLLEPFLGFVSRVREGYYGVEGFYDVLLRGEPGARLGELDGLGYQVPFGRGVLEPPQDGADFYLSIDYRVQYILWRELREGLELYKASSGSIIALDPRTGAILGAVSLPAYDPNTYETADTELYEDPIVSYQYEPGSVFKLITMAAGLDAGVITPETEFNDTGTFEIAGVEIRNWDRSSHGLVTMTEVLGLSLNTGLATISTTLGAEKFYEYVSNFGFGAQTGVDLQAEVAGDLKVPGDGRWYEADLATNSFGQGIAVTPLQMVAAVAAIANDGMLMRPYVVERIVSQGSTTETVPQPVRQVITPETAQTMIEMMITAVEEETEQAHVPGYTVAGKTGTAQIPIPGGYHPSDTIASFVGFLPAEDPVVCILVKIDKPQASQWGSQVAAPIFSWVAADLMTLLGVEPEAPKMAEAQ